jgi:cellulose synthase (UDP-forming)
MSTPYFKRFEARQPARFPAMTTQRAALWHLLAGMTVASAAIYLYWRWTSSLNPDAMVFSVVVAIAETLFFVGTLLFYFDIWTEGDTPQQSAPTTRAEARIDHERAAISVDVLITTLDEPETIVRPTIEAALALSVPANTNVQLYLLDDGNRPAMAQLAQSFGIGYFARSENEGFKAGNLRHALLRTQGDFVLICDADTRVLPGFLVNTLGYFRDPDVAWVQTPHWFYDIPEGETWQDWGNRRLPFGTKVVAPFLAALTGRRCIGQDPFMSDAAVFFDVIQRRRNRNGASFCCGAGSLHRREAIFDSALKQKAHHVAALRNEFRCRTRAPAATAAKLQPFRFHVSEDIHTSILLHGDPEASWISVYHPQVEARMLSPWSMRAWATQRLKYAGGTVDIMFHANPLWKRGMPWRIKLHYLSTFWSYLTSLWAPVLLLAPAVSLVTGWAPVKAYTFEFFARFLPMVVLGELAMVTACKGHPISNGRTLAVATLPLQWRALWSVLRGRRPRFPATPKLPFLESGIQFVIPNILLLLVLTAAGITGVALTTLDPNQHSQSFLMVNLFWLGWNMTLLGRVIGPALWRAPGLAKQLPRTASNRKGADVSQALEQQS